MQRRTFVKIAGGTALGATGFAGSAAATHDGFEYQYSRTGGESGHPEQSDFLHVNFIRDGRTDSYCFDERGAIEDTLDYMVNNSICDLSGWSLYVYDSIDFMPVQSNDHSYYDYRMDYSATCDWINDHVDDFTYGGAFVVCSNRDGKLQGYGKSANGGSSTSNNPYKDELGNSDYSIGTVDETYTDDDFSRSPDELSTPHELLHAIILSNVREDLYSGVSDHGLATVKYNEYGYPNRRTLISQSGDSGAYDQVTDGGACDANIDEDELPNRKVSLSYCSMNVINECIDRY